MSSFYIYNPEKERIGILQNETSVQWLENYQSPGEVRIEARATQDNIELLIDGNRIYNTDSDSVAKICHIDITQTETEESITARAVITSALLDDRVVMATEAIKNIELSMYSIYEKNRRGLPLEAATPKGYQEHIDSEITWGSVLESETKIAEISGFGFKVTFNPETGIETFEVYKGTDRTDDTSDEYIGYFGTDTGNLQNVSVISGSTSYKNVAVVAGAGDGADRIVKIVSLGTVSGEKRKELYVDARDLQREYQEAIPTGEYDEEGNPRYRYETRQYGDEEYLSILESRGLEKLSECLKDFSITCDIVQTNMYYGQDYFLGDRMPIKLPEYGIYTSARISSVTMIYETEGNRIVATLDDFR